MESVRNLGVRFETNQPLNLTQVWSRSVIFLKKDGVGIEQVEIGLVQEFKNETLLISD